MQFFRRPFFEQLASARSHNVVQLIILIRGLPYKRDRRAHCNLATYQTETLCNKVLESLFAPRFFIWHSP